jgi:ubiquinone/menaquinone biosynthesis C-methylase UbiE
MIVDMDNKVEYNRYNESSARKLETIESYVFSTANDFPEYLRQPYIFYVEQISNLIKPQMNVLELCCGDGIHTIDLARTGATITSTDIAENSIKLASIRLEREGFTNVTFEVADAEDLGNFSEDAYDIVACVGSLSYVDLDKFIYGVKRVLNKGGIFICLDSFNHNPVYSINRYLNYLLGRRSYSTIKRMPKEATLSVFKNEFASFQVYYFGIFSFLGKFLELIFKPARAKMIINNLDCTLYQFRKYAFKVVFLCTK